MRGEHVAAAAAGDVEQRFIPACAGNTSDSGDGQEKTAVHPRMRGEHRTAYKVAVDVGGSSPHARGTHL